jgi:hypothetical protein
MTPINYCSHSTTKQQIKELKFIKCAPEHLDLNPTTYQNQLIHKITMKR